MFTQRLRKRRRWREFGVTQRQRKPKAETARREGGGGGGGGGGGQGEDANVPRTLTGIILAVVGTFTHSQYHSTLARRI